MENVVRFGAKNNFQTGGYPRQSPMVVDHFGDFTNLMPSMEI